MLDWLPPLEDFRGLLRRAQEPAHDRLEKLAALSQHKLGFLEVIQLDRALGPLGAESHEGFASVRLAILSSATADHLVPAIRVGGLRRRLLVDVHVAPFGQYRQQLLDPQSPLHQVEPGMILFSLTAREAIAAVPLTATKACVDTAVGRFLDDLRVLWRKAKDTFNATVIQQTFLNTVEPLFGSYDRMVAGSPRQVITHLNQQLEQAAAQEGVYLLDVASESECDGLNAWFDM